MKTEIMIKINSDPKLHTYLRKNSYWYKYLNRSDKYFKDMISEFKMAERKEKTSKVSNTLSTLDTVNTIFKMLN